MFTEGCALPDDEGRVSVGAYHIVGDKERPGGPKHIACLVVGSRELVYKPGIQTARSRFLPTGSGTAMRRFLREPKY